MADLANSPARIASLSEATGLRRPPAARTGDPNRRSIPPNPLDRAAGKAGGVTWPLLTDCVEKLESAANQISNPGGRPKELRDEKGTARLSPAEQIDPDLTGQPNGASQPRRPYRPDRAACSPP